MLSCVSQRSSTSTVSPGTGGPVEHFEPALLSDEDFQRALMEAEESPSMTSEFFVELRPTICEKL